MRTQIRRMSVRTRSLALAALWFAGVGAAHAWDGVASGVVNAVEITGGSNYGFRVFVAGVTNMCGSGSNWAFLNESDSNYKTYVSAILMAKAQGTPVIVYTNSENGYCRIGYVSVQ
jgi:hypothetical protein